MSPGNPAEQVHVPPWAVSEGRVTAHRRAEFWRKGKRGAIHCDLCYRRCEIPAGESGWCRYRVNDAGQMALPAHGVVSCLVRQMSGYQVSPFLTYRPGELELMVGGTYCTAGCVFCMSADLTRGDPERVAWAFGERRVGQDGGWYARRAMLHPAGVVSVAQKWGCTRILFGINEPLLSWEFTYDVARLAQAAGLRVAIETQGFSEPPAIRKLAPHVDAVDVGIKGSADPDFYERWMRAPGSVPTVLKALKEWAAAGVHLIIGDVIATPRMQTAEAMAEAQKRLYGWIAAEIGPHALVLITGLYEPGPQQTNGGPGYFGMPDHRSVAGLKEQYESRISESLERARAAGLVYAHGKTNFEAIRCHNCAGVLLRFASPLLHCMPCTMPTHFCAWWTHKQHVTGGRCDHCGAEVPIQTMSRPDLDATRALVGQGPPMLIEQRNMRYQDPAPQSVLVGGGVG